MWVPDSVKSTPTGFCRWARNDRWTRCLKGTPGDSLSDVKGTAGSILSDLVFDGLLFWQWLQCTKCWIGRRIQLKGTGCQWQGEDGHPRSSGDEIWEVEIRKTSPKAGLHLICKCRTFTLMIVFQEWMKRLTDNASLFRCSFSWELMHSHRYELGGFKNGNYHASHWLTDSSIYLPNAFFLTLSFCLWRNKMVRIKIFPPTSQGRSWLTPRKYRNVILRSC